MGTWVLVDKPEGAVPIKNKFVFAKKRDKEGIVIKHKARLVAKVLRSSGLKVRRAQVTLRRVEWLKSLEYPKTELKSGKVMRLLR